MSKYALLGAILIGMSTCLLSADTIPGGNVSGILYEANSPYYVAGHLQVPNDSSLLVEAGVEVIFLAPRRIVVYGYLAAIGTASDSIRFTAEDTTTGWWGFFITDADETCEFKYCVLEHVHTGGGSTVRAAIRCRLSTVIVENSRINNCVGTDAGPAIKASQDADLHISNCVIDNNTTTANAGAIYLSNNAELYIDNTLINNNSSIDDGGAVYLSESDMYMDACTVYGNASSGHNGGAIYCNQSIVEIDYTVFSCNTVNYPSTSSQGGGAIYAEDCEINVRNCTFDRNAASYNGNGGAILGTDCVEYDIVNCIVHNNSAADEGGGVYSITNEPDITYSDFYNNTNGHCSGVVPAGFEVLSQQNYNGDSCDTYFNIFLCPDFTDSASGDYSLVSSSPCIDAGDPTSPLDPDNTVADMGAFYFDQTGIDETEQSVQSGEVLLSCCPNPSYDYMLLTYTTVQAGHVRVSLFDVSGRLVKRLVNAVQPAGTHSYTSDNMDLAEGTYIVLVETPYNTAAKMITILR